MNDLRAGGGHQTLNMPCQWQQRTGRHPWSRKVRVGWAFKIRGASPNQAPTAIRQSNRDEARATGTGKRQNRQVLTIQRMTRVSDRHRRDQSICRRGRSQCSAHVFALAHLLGFRFAPRIPNLADRKLYAFGSASTWPALAPFIAGKPDDKLIAAQWDDVLRMTASVRTGTVSAQAPGRLPAAEWAGPGAAGDRAHRAHPARPGLAGTAPASPAGDGRTEQR